MAMPRVNDPFDDDLVKDDQLRAPVRNTFVHFDEAPAFPSGFHRLHTCPAEVGMSYFFEKIGRSPVVTPAVGSRCPTPKFIQTAEQKKSAQDVPEEKKASEAGEQREEQEPQEDSVVLGEFFTVKVTRHEEEKETSSSSTDDEAARLSATEEEAAVDKEVDVWEKPCKITNWADLEDSDAEQPVAKPSKQIRWADLENSDDDEKEMKKPAVQKPSGPRRPVLSRPGREARVRQAQADVDEICSLEFDAVDASSQMGLTGRMLVALKSLAQQVVFWEAEGEKREEEKFRLLGLQEDDMYAIGKRIRKADKKIEERNYREAFDQMCHARRWLQDPEWAEQERARRAEKAEREPKEKQKKEKTGPKKEEEKTTACSDEEEWHVVKGANSSGSAEKKKQQKQLETVPQRCCAKEAAAEHLRKNGTTDKGMMKRIVQESSMPQGSAKGKASRQLSQQQTPPSTSQRASGWSQMERSAPRMTHHRVSTAQEPRVQETREVPTKFLCRFTVGIEPEVAGGFRVCRRIFGPGGENMKSIARDCNAKLRLRGRGSGFKEGPEMREAEEPLLLCVSAEDREGYEMAICQVTKLFEKIYEDYSSHCKRQRLPEAEFPRPSVRLQEHPGNPKSC